MRELSPFLETERLALWPLGRGDDRFFVDLDSDPEVMRYIHGGQPTSPTRAKEALERLVALSEARPGQGLWRTTLRGAEETVGWFTLKWLDALEAVEVGYRLYRRHWGNGYATEGTAALLEHGFETLDFPEIVGICHPENAASRRVLEKNGLVFVDERRIEIRGQQYDVAVLRLSRADFERKRGPR